MPWGVWKPTYHSSHTSPWRVWRELMPWGVWKRTTVLTLSPSVTVWRELMPWGVWKLGIGLDIRDHWFQAKSLKGVNALRGMETSSLSSSERDFIVWRELMPWGVWKQLSQIYLVIVGEIVWRELMPWGVWKQYPAALPRKKVTSLKGINALRGMETDFQRFRLEGLIFAFEGN